MMAERLKEQHEQHHGGNKWIGTGGTSAFGHSGYSPKGIRVGGPGKNRSALRWRNSGITAISARCGLQIRQFQVALKKLRLLSCREDGPKRSSMWRKRSRRPATKADVWSSSGAPEKEPDEASLLMDSGGSMWAYADLCNRLVQAVNQSSHFRICRVIISTIVLRSRDYDAVLLLEG